MEKPNQIPAIVSIIAIILGCLDLVRGFMHTLLLQYAAVKIAGLDLSTGQAADLLRLMGSFGISNYISGATLILAGWKFRPLALYLLGIIPAAYLLGGIAIHLNSADYTATQADWGGIPMMAVYLAVCTLTFSYGLWKWKK